MVRLIRSDDQFISKIRKRSDVRKSKRTKIIDNRKSRYNHIVCEDTGEVIRSYRAYLKSRHWSNVRKLFRKSKRHTGECLICSKKKNLQLHHLHYRFIGREHLKGNLACLVELCRVCHMNVHRAMDRNPDLSFDDIVARIGEV